MKFLPNTVKFKSLTPSLLENYLKKELETMISTMKNLESSVKKRRKKNTMKLGFSTSTQKTMMKLPKSSKVKQKLMEDINGTVVSKKKSLKIKLIT